MIPMHVKTQILKDYGLSASIPITAKTQTKSQYYWDYFLISKRASQLATTLSNSKVYELTVKHGISCQCRDRIPKKSVTCPTLRERLERKHRPGRPLLIRRV